MVWLVVLALGVMGALVGWMLARTPVPLLRSLAASLAAFILSSTLIRLSYTLRPPVGSGGIGAVSSGCAEALVALFAVLVGPLIGHWLAGMSTRLAPHRPVICGVLGALIGAMLSLPL
jgi:uncharacterized membrane protein YeaQ/YmgE (transglycosylase-associated protein family)